MKLPQEATVMCAAKPQQKVEPDPSSTSPVPAYTGSPIVDLLRKLLRHHIEFEDREEKALTCLWNAIGHIPDEKERQELSWIGPKGDIRTPWTSAMEFFYLSDTGIKESTLREYLATFTVAMHLGHHPNAAITGNVAVVGRLVALNEAGFTSKLVEHLRQEFPDEMDAIAGAAPSKGESGKTLGEPANDDSQAVDEKQGEEADRESEEPDRWLTVTDAERVSHIDKGVISRAADDGSLKSNGKKGRDRRIDAVDLTRWKLERSKNPEPDESNRKVENLVKKHVADYRSSNR